MSVLMERRKYKFWEALEMLNKTISSPELVLLRLPVITEESTVGGNQQAIIKDEKNKSKKKKFLKFDEAIIRKLIRAETPPVKDVDRLIIELKVVDGKLQKVLDDYLTNRTISDDFNVEGITIPIIMQVHRCGFFGALSFIPGYIENPEGCRELRKLLDQDPECLIRPLHIGYRPKLDGRSTGRFRFFALLDIVKYEENGSGITDAEEREEEM